MFSVKTVADRDKGIEWDILHRLVHAADVHGHGMVRRFPLSHHYDVRIAEGLEKFDFFFHVLVRVVRLETDPGGTQGICDFLRVFVVLRTDRDHSHLIG